MYAIDVSLCGSVIPGICHDAIHACIRSGKNHCVPGAGDRKGVLVGGICQVRPVLHQVPKTSGAKIRSEPCEVLVSELIKADYNNEVGLRGRSYCQTAQQYKSKKGKEWSFHGRRTKVRDQFMHVA